METFQHWRTLAEDAGGRNIWVYVPPGAGKTILSATVIDYLEQIGDSTSVALTTYFYLDARDSTRNSSFHCLTSILMQILIKSPEIPPAIARAYNISKQYGRSRISVSDNIEEVLLEVAATVPKLYLIVDALDECTSTAELCKSIVALSRSVPSLRLACFSRDVLCVRKELRDFSSIKVDGITTRSDILSYLADAVNSLPCFDLILKELALTKISANADGVFLFAYLSIQTLRSSISSEDMLAALERPLEGLIDIYHLQLRRLGLESKARRDLAQRTMFWVACCTRPLHWSELRSALSWSEIDHEFRSDREPFLDSVLELCCPLVEFDPDTTIFRFAHLSISEFLLDISNRTSQNLSPSFFINDEAFIHQKLTPVLLSFLHQNGIASAMCPDKARYPLLSYATDNLYHHLSSSQYSHSLCESYFEFISSYDRRITLIARSLMSEDWPFPLQRLLKLQKSVQIWTAQSPKRKISSERDLGDLVEALFQLDEFQIASLRSGSTGYKNISNFERSVIVRDLAREFTMAGQLERGVKIFEERLDFVGGENASLNPQTAWIINGLGILYDQQGRTEMAEAMQRRALRCQEEILPTDHLDTLLTVNELGRMCRHLGKLEDAETLHRRALMALLTKFPQTDPHVSWSKNALARCLLKRGLPDLALQLDMEVYAQESRLKGKDHPHPIWILSDMARCYGDKGDLEKAILMQEEVADRRMNIIGKDHPDTSWAMNSLALLYEAKGDLSTASKLHAAALEGQISSLGPTHNVTEWSREALTRLQETGSC
jgi:tetratricopeptide (TPR) repeat protein